MYNGSFAAVDMQNFFANTPSQPAFTVETRRLIHLWGTAHAPRSGDEEGSR